MYEFISRFICCVLWAFVCWYYADNIKTQYNEIDIDPNLYIAGGFIFGILSLLWCWNKKRCYLKYRR